MMDDMDVADMHFKSEIDEVPEEFELSYGTNSLDTETQPPIKEEKIEEAGFDDMPNLQEEESSYMDNSFDTSITTDGRKESEDILEDLGLSRRLHLEDEVADHLWMRKEMGVDSPKSILLAIWFFMSRYFGIGSRTDHSALVCGNVVVEIDSTGKRWLTFAKTNNRIVPRFPPKRLPEVIYGSEKELSRCPVSIFTAFMDHRPRFTDYENSPLYLQPDKEAKKRNDGVWFTSSGLGKNKIGGMLNNALKRLGMPTMRNISQNPPLIIPFSKRSESSVAIALAKKISNKASSNALKMRISKINSGKPIVSNKAKSIISESVVNENESGIQILGNYPSTPHDSNGNVDASSILPPNITSPPPSEAKIPGFRKILPRAPNSSLPTILPKGGHSIPPVPLNLLPPSIRAIFATLPKQSREQLNMIKKQHSTDTSNENHMMTESPPASSQVTALLSTILKAKRSIAEINSSFKKPVDLMSSQITPTPAKTVNSSEVSAPKPFTKSTKAIVVPTHRYNTRRKYHMLSTPSVSGPPSLKRRRLAANINVNFQTIKPLQPIGEEQEKRDKEEAAINNRVADILSSISEATQQTKVDSLPPPEPVVEIPPPSDLAPVVPIPPNVVDDPKGPNYRILNSLLQTQEESSRKPGAVSLVLRIGPNGNLIGTLQRNENTEVENAVVAPPLPGEEIDLTELDDDDEAVETEQVTKENPQLPPTPVESTVAPVENVSVDVSKIIDQTKKSMGISQPQMTSVAHVENKTVDIKKIIDETKRSMGIVDEEHPPLSVVENEPDSEEKHLLNLRIELRKPVSSPQRSVKLEIKALLDLVLKSIKDSDETGPSLGTSQVLTDILWQTGALGDKGPWLVIFSMWWMIQRFIGIGSRMNHVKLRWGHLRLNSEITATGEKQEFVEYRGPNGYISSKSSDLYKRVYSSTGKSPTTGEGPDFVHLYKFYIKRRLPTCLLPDSPFYLQPLQIPLSIAAAGRFQPMWFGESPLGKNRIGALMRNIVEKVVRPNMTKISGPAVESLRNLQEQASLLTTQQDIDSATATFGTALVTSPAICPGKSSLLTTNEFILTSNASPLTTNTPALTTNGNNTIPIISGTASTPVHLITNSRPLLAAKPPAVAMTTPHTSTVPQMTALNSAINALGISGSLQSSLISATATPGSIASSTAQVFHLVQVSPTTVILAPANATTSLNGIASTTTTSVKPTVVPTAVPQQLTQLLNTATLPIQSPIFTQSSDPTVPSIANVTSVPRETKRRSATVVLKGKRRDRHLHRIRQARGSSFLTSEGPYISELQPPTPTENQFKTLSQVIRDTKSFQAIEFPIYVSTLWERGVLGSSNPWSINFSIWFFNTLVFGVESRNEHLKLAWGDFKFCKTSDGREFIYFVNTVTGIRHFLMQNTPDEGEERCPIRIFKALQEMRPRNTLTCSSRFYLQPRSISQSTSTSTWWFTEQGWGKNKLGGLMADAAQMANLPLSWLKKRRSRNFFPGAKPARFLKQDYFPPPLTAAPEKLKLEDCTTEENHFDEMEDTEDDLYSSILPSQPSDQEPFWLGASPSLQGSNSDDDDEYRDEDNLDIICSHDDDNDGEFACTATITMEEMERDDLSPSGNILPKDDLFPVDEINDVNASCEEETCDSGADVNIEPDLQMPSLQAEEDVSSPHFSEEVDPSLTEDSEHARSRKRKNYRPKKVDS